MPMDATSDRGHRAADTGGLSGSPLDSVPRYGVDTGVNVGRQDNKKKDLAMTTTESHIAAANAGACCTPTPASKPETGASCGPSCLTAGSCQCGAETGKRDVPTTTGGCSDAPE